MDEISMFVHFLVCIRVSNDDVAVAWRTAFQKKRSRAGFETIDFVRRSSEGLA